MSSLTVINGFAQRRFNFLVRKFLTGTVKYTNSQNWKGMLVKLRKRTSALSLSPSLSLILTLYSTDGMK